MPPEAQVPTATVARVSFDDSQVSDIFTGHICSSRSLSSQQAITAAFTYAKDPQVTDTH